MAKDTTLRLGVRSIVVVPLANGGCRIEVYSGKRKVSGKAERLVLMIGQGRLQGRIDLASETTEGSVSRYVVPVKRLRIAYPKMMEFVAR